MRAFQALQASLSASIRASRARWAEIRTEVPNRCSRDFVVMADMVAGGVIRVQSMRWDTASSGGNLARAVVTCLTGTEFCGRGLAQAFVLNGERGRMDQLRRSNSGASS